jgi:hypothetical protein
MNWILKQNEKDLKFPRTCHICILTKIYISFFRFHGIQIRAAEFLKRTSREKNVVNFYHSDRVCVNIFFSFSRSEKLLKNSKDWKRWIRVKTDIPLFCVDITEKKKMWTGSSLIFIIIWKIIVNCSLLINVESTANSVKKSA